MDVDNTRADLLKYFKTKVIPSFPEETELSKEKIIKAAKSFYAKKGTPEGFKFLFRILYAQEIEVYFPKEDILKASDGKWQQPQALRISVANTATAVTGGNVNVFISRANTVNANGINLVTAGITANSYIRIGNEQRKVLTVNSVGDYATVDVPFAYLGVPQIYNSETLYKITLNDYSDFDFNLLERRKGVGSISKTTCIVESAVRTVDKDTGRDIAEIYVSNVRRPFNTNENIEISYVDPTTNTTQTFSSKIISLVSNIKLYKNRFGKVQNGAGYKTGDPVVFYGGLSNTDEAQKAVATVKDVSTGQIDFVTLETPGYFFRDWQNSIVRIANTSNGISGNLIIDAIWEDGSPNSASFTFNTDSIAYKLNTTLDAADYGFANIPSPGVTDSTTVIGDALSYQTYTLGKIRYLTLVNRGSFFESTPTFDPISLHETDYSETVGFLSVPGSAIQNYSPLNKTIDVVGSSYSSVNNFYAGARFFVQTTSTSAHYAKVLSSTVTGSGASKTNTLTLDIPFESNITALNAGNFTYYFDFRADVRGTGRLGKVDIVNAGTGYSGTDVVHFIGTGYGASATITVNGSGAITAVALTANGEGYYSRPTCVIRNSSGGASGGSGATLIAYTLSDGETITAATTGIGEIQSFNLISRGYDYANTPNVSLKVVDILSDNLSTSALVVSGDAVWQGGATNVGATFSGMVDEVYRETPTSSVIRVFNYNGNLDHTLPLKINTATGNVTTNVHYVAANISFNGVNPATSRLYPFFYGNGLAKANAEFASGLIKYDGYYLNTDGHISADKKLQNKDYYHNFSYEIQSEKSLNEYKKTVYSVAHPAGMQLLSKYVMNNFIDVGTEITSQSSITLDSPGFEGAGSVNATPIINSTFAEYEIMCHMDGANGSSTFVDSTGNYTSIDSYYFGANSIYQTDQVTKSGYGNSTKFPYVYQIAFNSYSGGYVIINTNYTGLNTKMASGTDWTLEGWFYTTSTRSDQCLIYYGGAAGNYIRIGLTGTTTKTVALTGLWTTNSTTTNFALNTWYHFALVRDSATFRFRLYVNGKFEKESGVITGGIPADADFRIGADISAGLSSITQNDCFTGYMDEISLRLASTYYTANTTPGVSTYTIPSSPLVESAYTYNMSGKVLKSGANFNDATEGDLIVIDPNNRNITKVITSIGSEIYIESPISFLGDGRISTTSACNQVVVSGNSNTISSTVQVDDFLEFRTTQKSFYANSVNVTVANMVFANTSNLSSTNAGFDQLTPMEIITIGDEMRLVLAVANANCFTVTENFTNTGTDKLIEQGSSFLRKVTNVSGNVITLDATSPSSNSNVLYKIHPTQGWVPFEIIKPM